MDSRSFKARSVILGVIALAFSSIVVFAHFSEAQNYRRQPADRLAAFASVYPMGGVSQLKRHYPPPFPPWPNALALTTTINPLQAARNIKAYDSSARSFYMTWKPNFVNVDNGISGWNGPDNFVNSDGPGDGFYRASSSDPTYELSCVGTAYCGYSNHIAGLHIPNGARTQNSGARNCDCHLYVLQPKGWSPINALQGEKWPNVSPNQYEIDLENASNTAAGAGSPDADGTTFANGGTIFATGGAIFSTGSTGWYGGSSSTNNGFSPANDPPTKSWGGSATHGNSPYSATTISAADFIQGAINHEIFMNVVCAENAQPDSWPSSVGTSDFSCGKLGGVGWSYGDHLWLSMSDAEIDSAALTPIQKIFAKGLAHYGAVILDIQTAWGPTFHVNVTSGDPGWSTVAKIYSLESVQWHGLTGFQLNMGLPFDVMNRVHAINSCVISHTC